MKLAWRRQRLASEYRFVTSHGGVDGRDTVVASIEHGGVVGLGEATPSALYGQTVESTETALAAISESGKLGDDPFLIEPILARLIERHDGQRAAVGAIDAALHDWVGKRLGVPVWRLLGLGPPRVRTAFTIGMAAPTETRHKVREALADGYQVLKVKIGGDGDHDTLGAIRELFDGPLLLDANCAWSVEQALAEIPKLARYRPSMIEQPLAAGQWREMRWLRELGVAPIFADESCERPADVARLAGCVDGVNIKLGKCGGIREALRMAAIARGLGMGVMFGCFVSSSLSIAQALQIATPADWVDLDGHLLLREDPFEGIGRAGGEIFLEERAGLGVREAGAERTDRRRASGISS
jgi:L-alanine-DL-glutamate epimerase-like enolase superfamily enzyme